MKKILKIKKYFIIKNMKEKSNGNKIWFKIFLRA